MDSYTEKHLKAWITRTIPNDSQSMVLERMSEFLTAYPDLAVGNRSWPEIRNMANKWAERQKICECSDTSCLAHTGNCRQQSTTAIVLKAEGLISLCDYCYSNIDKEEIEAQ